MGEFRRWADRETNRTTLLRLVWSLRSPSIPENRRTAGKVIKPCTPRAYAPTGTDDRRFVGEDVAMVSTHYTSTRAQSPHGVHACCSRRHGRRKHAPTPWDSLRMPGPAGLTASTDFDGPSSFNRARLESSRSNSKMQCTRCLFSDQGHGTLLAVGLHQSRQDC